MTSVQKRTAAVAPADSYRRPRLVDPDGLRVTVTTEDGDTRVFDFSDLDAPPGLVGLLVAAFADVSGPAGTWRQMTTIHSRLARTASLPAVRHRRALECGHDHGPHRGCMEGLAREHRYSLRLEWSNHGGPDVAA